MGCSDSGRLSPDEINALPVSPQARFNLLYDYWQTCVKPGNRDEHPSSSLLSSGDGPAGAPAMAMIATPQILEQLIGKQAQPLDEKITQFADTHKVAVTQVDGKL